jgi:hypothetical protein
MVLARSSDNHIEIYSIWTMLFVLLAEFLSFERAQGRCCATLAPPDIPYKLPILDLIISFRGAVANNFHGINMHKIRDSNGLVS